MTRQKSRLPSPKNIRPVVRVEEVSTDSESSQQVPSEHLAEGADHGHSGGHGPKVGMGALALGALGIVYGDIGTSPPFSSHEHVG